MMLSPLSSRKALVVLENAVRSLRKAFSFCSFETRVLPVFTVLRRVAASCGHDVGVGVGDRRQQLDVVDQCRDLGVEPLQVAVQRHHALAELLAASLEGVGQGVQGVVELGRLHGAQERVEVVQHALDLDRQLGLRRSCRRPRATPRTGPSGCSSSTYFSPNRVLGTSAAVTFVGDRLDLVGLDAERRAWRPRPRTRPC